MFFVPTGHVSFNRPTPRQMLHMTRTVTIRPTAHQQGTR
jgi:hypothetical protein